LFTSVYDDDGRLTNLTNPQGEVTSFTFDAAGQNTVKDLDNGTRAAMSFDAAGNLVQVVNLDSASTTLSSYNYGFDCIGNRTGATELNGDYSNWSADRVSQIRGDSYYNSTWSWNTLTLPQWEVATADDWDTLPVDALAAYSFNYTYDATGNIISQTDPDSGAITTSTYDHTNRLLTTEDVSGITTYSYDANGNQTSIEEANGDVTTNTWDGENRLVQVEHPDFTMTTYVYDADGHRIEKDDGVDVTRFVYDGNNVVQERDDVGTVEAEFTYIPAAYAQVISQRRDDDSSFYAFDGIANTVALTDDAAVVTDEYALSAWGEQRSSTGSTANSQIYKGQFLAYYNDPNAGPETSLYSTHHRNYSAKQKQFTSSDPSESDINSSRYVKNNPINEVDPSGLKEIPAGNPSRVANQKPATQPIRFDQISIEEMMSSLLGEVHGPGFLQSQGVNSSNRVIDLMIAGWKIDFKHNQNSQRNRYHIDRPSHVLTIYTGYTKETQIPGEGAITRSESIHYDNLTIYRNLNKAISDQGVTKHNYGAAKESSLAAGASVFAAHPNVRIITGALEVAGAAAVIVTSGGGAIPVIIAGYSGVRGLENVGSGVIESATGNRPRDLSHQLGDLATGDKETTDNIFFITDIGVAVIDTAAGVRLFLKKGAAKGAAKGKANLADETQDVVGHVDDIILPNKVLVQLQETFNNLVETHLLPKFKELDPNLKWGYTGSFKTGKVGNPHKSTFGNPIDLSEFDVDFWIESDVLFEKFGQKLKADVKFREILSETPGFEGLKPNKKGFSILFKPSTLQ